MGILIAGFFTTDCKQVHESIKRYFFPTPLIFLLSLFSILPATGQSPADISLAETYAKKYPDDGVVCISSKKTFSFDIGKNELGDQVVQVTEESEYEFLSLKRFASLMYPEFYNKLLVSSIGGIFIL